MKNWRTIVTFMVILFCLGYTNGVGTSLSDKGIPVNVQAYNVSQPIDESTKIYLSTVSPVRVQFKDLPLVECVGKKVKRSRKLPEDRSKVRELMPSTVADLSPIGLREINIVTCERRFEDTDLYKRIEGLRSVKTNSDDESLNHEPNSTESNESMQIEDATVTQPIPNECDVFSLSVLRQINSFQNQYWK